MSIENPTYKATYHRPREVWRDAWIQCEEHRIYYRLGTESGFCMIAQWLKAQGKPDGDILILQVQGKGGIRSAALPAIHFPVGRSREYCSHSSQNRHRCAQASGDPSPASHQGAQGAQANAQSQAQGFQCPAAEEKVCIRGS